MDCKEAELRAEEEGPAAQTSDIGFSRDSAVDGCKNSLNFFAAVSLPEVYRFPFPPILLAIWQMLCTAVGKPDGQEKLAVGLPRGFAKTLLLKLFVIYCVLFTDRRFILVVCNTATLAENFIADIVDTLSSPNIIRIFGDWRLGLEKDTQELKKFTFKGRNIILAGLGSGSSLPMGTCSLGIQKHSEFYHSLSSTYQASIGVACYFP